MGYYIALFFVITYYKIEEGNSMFDKNVTQNYDFDSTIMGNNNVIENDFDINMVNNGQMQGMPMMQQGGVNEGIRERVINRTFVHEVPHVCPIHTRIINHHVYKHTYRPVYTCSEENTVSNIQCGSCCQFR